MNLDRRLGAWIFFGLGAALVSPSVLPAWESAKDIAEEFELWKASWCLGWVLIGFAMNAFKASRNKRAITTGAWPLYLFKYLPLLLIAALFMYFAVDVYTCDRPRYFYYLATFIGFFIGYDIDRVINRPLKFLKDFGANTTGP